MQNFSDNNSIEKIDVSFKACCQSIKRIFYYILEGKNNSPESHTFLYKEHLRSFILEKKASTINIVYDFKDASELAKSQYIEQIMLFIKGSYKFQTPLFKDIVEANLAASCVILKSVDSVFYKDWLKQFEISFPALNYNDPKLQTPSNRGMFSQNYTLKGKKQTLKSLLEKMAVFKITGFNNREMVNIFLQDAPTTQLIKTQLSSCMIFGRVFEFNTYGTEREHVFAQPESSQNAPSERRFRIDLSSEEFIDIMGVENYLHLQKESTILALPTLSNTKS